MALTPGGIHHPGVSTALVTGSAARLADVTPALEKEGFFTLCAMPDALHLLPELRRAGLYPGTLDCYVQMPTTDLISDSTATLAGLRALVANALLTRFDALALIAPLLAPGARLVLVAGDRTGTTTDADLGLPDMSGVLAEAVLAGTGAKGVRTTLIGTRSTAADIAVVARGPADDAPPAAALEGYAAVAPELSYVDWRDEVLGLAAELS